MIPHENDVTNHRIMWLLVLQGFIANTYVGAVQESADTVSVHTQRRQQMERIAATRIAAGLLLVFRLAPAGVNTARLCTLAAGTVRSRKRERRNGHGL
jgi:hypothetical protein